jgi:arsenate reductase (thioredoxin)
MVAGSLGESESRMKRILFVCVENAGRSQMAEAFANQLGKGRVIAESAGTIPAKQVNPVVVKVMMEKGLDISHNRPAMLELGNARRADMIVTMGCSVAEVCPAPLLKNSVDWALEDPKGKPVEKVRQIRDEIERRVQRLLSEL